MSNLEEIVSNLTMELRRGILVLCVLSQLEEEQYGYSLVQSLAERGMIIDQSTLYPLLRRLEKQGLLDSNWSLNENRPRRYYVLNEKGKRVLNRLIEEWTGMNSTITKLLEAKNGDEDNERLD